MQVTNPFSLEMDSTAGTVTGEELTVIKLNQYEMSKMWSVGVCVFSSRQRV